MKWMTNQKIIFVLLLFLLFCMTIGSFFVGRYEVNPKEFFDTLIGEVAHAQIDYNTQIVFLKIRLPRILAAILVGGALAASGSTYQGIFGNPLISPDLLGATSGAGLGACIAIILNLNPIWIQIAAFAGGLGATLFTCFLSNLFMKGNNSVVVYILIGMVISAVFKAGISISKYVCDPYNDLQTITFWLMGSLSAVQMEDVFILAIIAVVSMIPIFLNSWKINLLSFSEEEAMSMGIHTRFFRLEMILAATLLCSASVAIGGIIGWVGLVIPHIARLLAGPNMKKLIPMAFLIGGIYLLFIDDISRSLFAMEIPIGILTSIIGAPVLIGLLIRGRTGWK